MDGNDDVVPKVDRKVETSDEVVVYCQKTDAKRRIKYARQKPCAVSTLIPLGFQRRKEKLKSKKATLAIRTTLYVCSGGSGRLRGPTLGGYG